MGSSERVDGLVRLLGLGAALLLSASPALADDVKVDVKGKKLVIKGDGDGNDITLTSSITLKGKGGGPSPVSVHVTPSGDTTINGLAAPEVFDGVVDISANLGDGDDSVTCDAVSIDGKLSLNGSGGDDNFEFLNGCTFGKGLSVIGGPGALNVTADGVGGAAVSVKGGSEAD